MHSFAGVYRKYSVIISLLVLLAAIFVLDGVEIPAQSRPWRELLNAGHAPLFGVVALAMLIIAKRFSSNRWSPIFPYILAFAAAGGLGLVTELIQYFTPRDASIQDMIYNIVGIVGSLAITASLDMSLRRHRVFGTLILRNLIRFGAVLLFSTAFITFGTIVLAHSHRARQFPVILDFESWLDNKFITATGASLEFEKPPSEWGVNTSGRSAVWTIHARVFSSVTIHYPYPIWRGYSFLCLSIFSPQEMGRVISLRVNDIFHNFEYSDRYNTSLTIRPGHNEIRIPISEIENAPQGRKMDLSGIANIILFCSGDTRPSQLYLDNIRLE